MEIPKIDFSNFMRSATESMSYKSENKQEEWYSTECFCGFKMTCKTTREKCPNCKRVLKWKRESK